MTYLDANGEEKQAECIVLSDAEGGSGGLAFTSDAPFEKFVSVKVDGTVLAASDNPGDPGNREEPKEPGNREEPGNPDNPNNPGNFDKPDSAVNRAIEQTENPRPARFGDFDVQAGCGAFP